MEYELVSSDLSREVQKINSEINKIDSELGLLDSISEDEQSKYLNNKPEK